LVEEREHADIRFRENGLIVNRDTLLHQYNWWGSVAIATLLLCAFIVVINHIGGTILSGFDLTAILAVYFKQRIRNP